METNVTDALFGLGPRAEEFSRLLLEAFEAEKEADQDACLHCMAVGSATADLVKLRFLLSGADTDDEREEYQRAIEQMTQIRLGWGYHRKEGPVQ